MSERYCEKVMDPCALPGSGTPQEAEFVTRILNLLMEALPLAVERLRSATPLEEQRDFWRAFERLDDAVDGSLGEDNVFSHLAAVEFLNEYYEEWNDTRLKREVDTK